ncbi:Hypothetical_protein [Hexamita inflata]|uniref:Hypothetical_protein n=1 Tax=Hexamita inflata TaxID=28002 RepID=A0AA86P5R0_9EUKA|nr:Hypothetical protein HINF_LOCUS18821 [Hexamita inflata]
MAMEQILSKNSITQKCSETQLRNSGKGLQHCLKTLLITLKIQWRHRQTIKMFLKYQLNLIKASSDPQVQTTIPMIVSKISVTQNPNTITNVVIMTTKNILLITKYKNYSSIYSKKSLQPHIKKLLNLLKCSKLEIVDDFTNKESTQIQLLVIRISCTILIIILVNIEIKTGNEQFYKIAKQYVCTFI